MSLFTIKTDVLYRFSKLTNKISPDISTVVRLEKRDGKIYAIATDERIAIVEYLGTTVDDNEVCHVKLTEELIDRLQQEYVLDSDITIQTIPELAMSTLTTSMGNSYGDCFVWLDNTPLNDWEMWLNIDEEESKGRVYCELYQIYTLFETSPSGKILFPEIINTDKPVMVTDVENDNWVGIFIPTSEDKTVKNVETPMWVREI